MAVVIDAASSAVPNKDGALTTGGDPFLEVTGYPSESNALSVPKTFANAHRKRGRLEEGDCVRDCFGSGAEVNECRGGGGSRRSRGSASMPSRKTAKD